MPDEDGEAAQHQAFEVGQQPVAPIERRLQGLLPRRRRARPDPQQGQALVEQGGGLLQAVGLDPPGGELDRERDAVELAADRDDDRGFRIGQLEVGAARRRALDEQPGRGKCLGGRGGERLAVRRTGERLEAVDVLAIDLERLATGREDVDLRSGLEQACDQHRDGIDEMLAGIEDQQNSLVAQMRDQARRRIARLNGEAEHGGGRGGHQVRIAQHGEIDEEHGASKGFEQVMPDRDRGRRLADAAGTDDGDEARRR